MFGRRKNEDKGYRRVPKSTEEVVSSTIIFPTLDEFKEYGERGISGIWRNNHRILLDYLISMKELPPLALNGCSKEGMKKPIYNRQVVVPDYRSSSQEKFLFQLYHAANYTRHYAFTRHLIEQHGGPGAVMIFKYVKLSPNMLENKVHPGGALIFTLGSDTPKMKRCFQELDNNDGVGFHATLISEKISKLIVSLDFKLINDISNIFHVATGEIRSPGRIESIISARFTSQYIAFRAIQSASK